MFILFGVFQRKSGASQTYYAGGIHMSITKEVLMSNYCNREFEYYILGSSVNADGKAKPS